MAHPVQARAAIIAAYPIESGSVITEASCHARPSFARVLAALVVCISTTTALSQEVVDLGVVDRIKDEAFTRSEVMEHLRNLTDVHGPRLTGSPQFDEAAKWAQSG